MAALAIGRRCRRLVYWACNCSDNTARELSPRLWLAHLVIGQLRFFRSSLVGGGQNVKEGWRCFNVPPSTNEYDSLVIRMVSLSTDHGVYFSCDILILFYLFAKILCGSEDFVCFFLWCSCAEAKALSDCYSILLLCFLTFLENFERCFFFLDVGCTFLCKATTC